MPTYKEDLEIDKYSLDDELQKQAMLFAEWAEKEVDAQFERDKAKERLEVVKAEADRSIRAAAEKRNAKITESAIQNMVILHEGVREANSEHLDSVKNAKVMAVAREAFEHKKRALEKMVDLFLSNYWAEPRIKAEAEDLHERNRAEGLRKATEKAAGERIRRAKGLNAK